MVTSGLSWIRGGIPGIYLVLLYDQLSALGLDTQALFADIPLSREQLLAPDRRVSLAQAQNAAQRAVAMAAEQGLGFRYARAMGITLHGSLGLLAMSSASADDALQASCKYLALRAPFLAIERQLSKEDQAAITLRTLLPLGPVHDFVIEAVLVGLVFMVEQLLGRSPQGLAIHRCGPPPPYLAALLAAVPVPVHFDQPRDGLVFPQAALAAQPRLADPQQAALAREQCELELRQWRSRHEGVVAERVRSALSDHPAPLPSLEAMAERLAVSPRTLKRHLQQAGLSYRQLQDQERYQQACQLLSEGNRRISEVAYSLGYNDVANFSRAFKRWSGLTPRAFQDNNRL